jgi:hypothetical protein
MSARNVTKSGTYQQGARSSAGEGECVWLHVTDHIGVITVKDEA